MKIDVLFADAACFKPYNHDSLENDFLGGTEYGTIRLAEGLAKTGKSVAVVTKFDEPASTSPNGVWYAPKSFLSQVKPKNVIHLRYRGMLDRFPDAKQFIWLHDKVSLEHNNISDWPEIMKKYDATAIVQSDWHLANVKSLADMPVIRIYPPLDEECHTSRPKLSIDNDQLVWMSSPHKGLAGALDVFKEVLARDPQMKLVVFNPGYYFENLELPLRVVSAPKVSRHVLRNVISRSLCIFYPTDFEETFGSIAAEANGLGTPIAHYGVAALNESSNEPGIAKDKFVETVLSWKSKRPETNVQARFKTENVVAEWLKILS